MSSELHTPSKDLDEAVVSSAEYDLQDDYEAPADEAAYHEYRSLSIAAVAALIFGLLSAVVLPVVAVASVLLVVPVMGVLLGLFATWTIASRPEEFTGKRIALVGMGLSVVMFVAGIGLNHYLNRIQVPPEYADSEIHFWELQSEEDIDMNYLMSLQGQRVDLPLPERALELNGKKVFITGYVYPGEQKTGLDKFVLVPDMGSCCFGGQPKWTDMIEVKLAEPLRVDYSMWRRGVGGTLRVNRTLQAHEKLKGVIYSLEADYLSDGPGVTGSADNG